MTKKRTLTPFEEYVLLQKGTEPPFTGEYTDLFDDGVYCCKQCGVRLFESGAKFHSGCGWPSFDDALPEAVGKVPDADGTRTEIICAACGGHLGHVFPGEGFTQKNIRHCVNSVSLAFIPADEIYETAYFASGCFWGTEYWFQKAKGVKKVRSGYTGGQTPYPSYEDVCTGKTGHTEAVEVLFNPLETNFEELARLFFNTHNPTELNRQGPDIGTQYRSEIFYTSEQQKEIAENLIQILIQKGIPVVTVVSPFSVFYCAEEYHQNYYALRNKKPYCHIFTELFSVKSD